MTIPSQIRPLGRFSNFFQAFLIFILVLTNLIPLGNISGLGNYIWLACMIGWLIFVFFLRPSFYLKLKSPVFAMAFFVLYSIIVPFITGNYIISNRYISLAQIPFFYVAFCFNQMAGNNKTNYSIIKWTLLPIIVVSINTFTRLLENPYASRQANVLKTQSLNENILLGGYELMYFLTIFSIILFVAVYLDKANKDYSINKYLLLFLTFFFILTISLSNFLTAFLIIISSLLFFLTLKNNNSLLIFIIPISLIVIILWELEILNLLIDLFQFISPEGKIVDKLLDFKRASTLNESDSIFSSRNDTYISSLTGFIENPIFGKAITSFSVRDNFHTGFGQHSQILDSIALFGIFGFIQIYYIIKVFTIRLRSGFRLINAFTLSIMFAVLTINLFNNTTALTGYAYFFIYPTLFSSINRENSAHVKA